MLYKLIIFALLMAVAPIGTYFGSLHYLWEGESAGGRTGHNFGPMLPPASRGYPTLKPEDPQAALQA